MKKLTIIDFNRTIYDPESDMLLEGAVDTLTMLRNKGFLIALVSRIEPGREGTLKKFNIADHFNSVHFVPSKSSELFREIMNLHGAKPDTTYVIGDYLHDEIRSGNCAGMRTIWLQQGAFSHLRPEGTWDIPWKTISKLEELKDELFEE